MKILLVNDDGIDSPYLRLLCGELAGRGHTVCVCAPAEQQSAKGHCMTIHGQIRVEPRQVDGAQQAWAVSGTPVDCTRIGLLAIFPEAELVISGINDGPNAGCDLYPSGTVGAAREAAFRHYRAMALSTLWNIPEETLAYCAKWGADTAEKLARMENYPDRCLLNVNFPSVPVREIRGAVLCPVGAQEVGDVYKGEPCEDGAVLYTPQYLVPEQVFPDGTDVGYLYGGWIACSFLGMENIDQTPFEGIIP